MKRVEVLVCQVKDPPQPKKEPKTRRPLSPNAAAMANGAAPVPPAKLQGQGVSGVRRSQDGGKVGGQNSNNCNNGISSSNNNSNSLTSGNSSNNNHSGIRFSRPVTAMSNRASIDHEREQAADSARRWNYSSSLPDREILTIESEILRSLAEPPGKVSAPGSPDRKHLHASASEIRARGRSTSGPVIGLDSTASESANLQAKWNIMTKVSDDEERLRPVLGQYGRDRESFHEQFRPSPRGSGAVRSQRSISDISVYR